MQNNITEARIHLPKYHIPCTPMINIFTFEINIVL